MFRHVLSTLTCLTLLAACGTPVSETIAGAADRDTVWQLQKLDGAPFPAIVTLSFRADGSMEGQAPCNGFTARQTLPLPWFQIKGLTMTRRTCPEQAAEDRFLAILQEMEFAEVAGNVMLLTGGASHSLEFRARP